MAQAALIIPLLIEAGILYPIYLTCTGQAVTATSLVISGLTVLAVFTFFYTPYYFVLGGAAFAAIFTLGVHYHETFMYASNFSRWGYAWLIFGFLTLGILQKFIRNQLF